jgi:hypothetical protein
MKITIALMALTMLTASVNASAQAPPTRTYSGGIVGNGSCNRNGQGPVIKHSPGTIITIHAAGGEASNTLYVLLFNKTTVPLNGDVPAIAITLTPELSSADRDYPGGLPMTTGISWALSYSPSRLDPACHSVTLTVTYQ